MKLSTLMVAVAFAAVPAFAQTHSHDHSASAAGTAGTPASDAEVRKVDKDARKITLKHGEIKNLEEVVRHYNKGGAEAGTYSGTKSAKLAQLDLSELEIVDLVDFMKTLTAPLPPEEWTRDIAKH